MFIAHSSGCAAHVRERTDPAEKEFPVQLDW